MKITKSLFMMPYAAMAITALAYVFKWQVKMYTGDWVNSPAVTADAYHNLADLIEVDSAPLLAWAALPVTLFVALSIALANVPLPWSIHWSWVPSAGVDLAFHVDGLAAQMLLLIFLVLSEKGIDVRRDALQPRRPYRPQRHGLGLEKPFQESSLALRWEPNGHRRIRRHDGPIVRTLRLVIHALLKGG